MRRGSISMVVGVVLTAVIGLAASGCAARDAGTPAAQESEASAADKAIFDPLVRPVTFGWLPDGMVHRRTEISTERYELLYVGGGTDEFSVSSAEIHLQVWPPDLAFWQQPGAESYEFSDTVEVNGEQALWRSIEEHVGELRWEYRPRSWAWLVVRDPTGDPLETGRRVALSARFEATERVRLPWRLAGVPPELSVRSLMVIEESEYMPWVAEIAFFGSAGDRSGRGPQLTVRADQGPVSPDPNYHPEPNTSVHGFPAMLEDYGSEGGNLSIYDPADIVHRVYASASAIALLGPAGLVGLAERFELLGEPPTWTDRPLG